jgi:hypothetical protein
VDTRTRLGWTHGALALALTLVLGSVWLRNDWAALSQGILPDSDDMVRLAQVRDWLGGQSFTDLTQHRLGVAGSGTLHWSRLGDFGVVAWILALRPVLGAAQADIWAAILWPLTMFLTMLLMTARVTLRLGARHHATLAILIAAFAFPAITMFVPGRIDHHGLQIVLTLALLDALLCPAGARSGAVAGLVAAAMLALGLETAPIVAVAMAVLGIMWLVTGVRESRRVIGFGLMLGATTLAWLAIAKTDVWPQGWCDGFTPASTGATFAIALFWIVLGALTRVAVTPLRRLLMAAVLGLPVLASLWATSSVCITGPYGPLDPVLARLWLTHVEEARGLFADGIGKALAFGGLAVAGLVMAALMALRSRKPGWLVVLAFQAMALAVTCFQLRGAAIAAALAPPALAMLIAAARRRGNIVGLALAWIVSAGLAWNMIGRVLDQRRPPPAIATVTGADCTAPETLAQLRGVPTGRILSTIDAGAYILGATAHSVIAAPYHRNNAGNRAAYDFWLAKPGAAQAIASRARADYVLACPDAFGGLDLKAEGPGGMAMLLDWGPVPGWLAPVALPGSAAKLYRILPPKAQPR